MYQQQYSSSVTATDKAPVPLANLDRERETGWAGQTPPFQIGVAVASERLRRAKYLKKEGEGGRERERGRERGREVER